MQSLVGTWQIVFRVENSKGIGPYHNSDINNGLLSQHSWSNGKHPTPYADFKIGRGPIKRERCAFIDLDQLLAWFSGEELCQLEKLGYTIVPVKGKITAVGNKQVLYTRR